MVWYLYLSETPVSHLLTAGFETPTALASCSWVTPFSLRKFTIVVPMFMFPPPALSVSYRRPEYKGGEINLAGVFVYRRFTWRRAEILYVVRLGQVNILPRGASRTRGFLAQGIFPHRNNYPCDPRSVARFQPPVNPDSRHIEEHQKRALIHNQPIEMTDLQCVQNGKQNGGYSQYQ